jgi:Ca-activated chloride channel family protein
MSPSPAPTRSISLALVLFAARLLLLPLLLPLLAAGCSGGGDRALLPKTQTWAELRTVRRSITVTPPGETARAPYPRERLIDGQSVEVGPEGLAWIRRDGGATLLVRGPAKLVVRSDSINLTEGRVFIDTPATETAEIETPSGPLHLANVRASIDVKPGGAGPVTEAYVLAGEVRTDGAAHAKAGERLLITGKPGAQKAEVSAALAWEDWTGGLATTDRTAAPAPFGVGTVGARTPGEQGTPRFSLAIQKLDVRVTIDREFAVTEVDQVFFNPSSEVVEGVYRFRTPERATLHRFGVDRGGVLVWGRVKEKQAAAAQYQSNVYQGSTEDPALLEWDAPGVYKARLYPIGPGEARRVVVRYAEWLGRTGKKGERRLYVYPMGAEGAASSLPLIEEMLVTFDLGLAGAKEVRAGMAGVLEGNTVIVREHDFVPRADLALELFDLGTEAPGGYTAPHAMDYEVLAPSDRPEALRRSKTEADYVLVTVRPEDIPLAKGGLDLAIVIDASAATDTASLAIARSAAAALLAHLGADDRAGVWAGDVTLRPVVASRPGLGPIDEAARREILRSIATIERGGATDLGAMLSQAAAALDPARRGAVVYIGDGAPTVGELSLAAVRDRLDRLPRPVRIFGLGVGDSANMALLEGIARGATAARISDGNEAARAALRLLESAERPALLGASIDLGPSVERVFPRDLRAIVADESVVVIGRVLPGNLPKSVAMSGPTGATARLPLLVTAVRDGGDLTRRWAEGRLAQALDEGSGRAAMVDLGVRHGIITPVTSLYVQTTREMSQAEREALERAQREARDGITVSKSYLSPSYLKQLTPEELIKKDQEDAEKAMEEKEAEQVAENNADNKEGGTGTRAKGEEGSMGNPNTKASGNRYGVQGPADNPDPHMARQQALRDSAEFGMIGLLNSGAGGDPNAPTAPWGRDDSLGNDPSPPKESDNAQAAKGNMWGSEVGESFGSGGLGLSGIAEGGGGRGEGIGLGSIGTIGKGAGTGTGQGFGSGHGRLGGAHKSSPPRVRAGAATVSGRLPPEVIQRIVRQNFGRFRLCYEAGLNSNPNLQGRVAVRFVIRADGEVNNVGNGGSDMPDSGVVSCVVRAFNGLSFPQPEDRGTVTVVFPIMFSPGGGTPTPEDKEEERAAKAKTAEERAKPGTKTVIEIRVGDMPHTAKLCGEAASLPLEERAILWRERLARFSSNPESAASVYRKALANCEAPSWRERSRLLSIMLDAIPGMVERVALWRAMLNDGGAGDALYRGMLSRVRTADQARELNRALGLKSIDPQILAKAMKEAKSPQDRVARLRAFTAEWPDDHTLSLRLLDALEDAGDAAGARALGRSLRARPDADARIRTAVGELSLRLAARAGNPDEKALDEAEARRAFGEIVEFAPDDPVARRRLGDLLRAHGWFADAARQYETLALLAPDDPSVALLRAAAAEGLGKLEEAVRWTEKGGSAGAPDVEQSPAFTARAFAATYLAWGMLAAKEAGKMDELGVLSTRFARVAAGDPGGAKPGARVSLTWAHPELHPVIWSNALGAPMPAREGDVTLGIAQVTVPDRAGAFVEVRIEPDELDHVARLGAAAILTVIWGGAGGPEAAAEVIKLPVSFTREGPPVRRFAIEGRTVRPL